MVEWARAGYDNVQGVVLGQRRVRKESFELLHRFLESLKRLGKTWLDPEVRTLF